ITEKDFLLNFLRIPIFFSILPYPFELLAMEYLKTHCLIHECQAPLLSLYLAGWNNSIICLYHQLVNCILDKGGFFLLICSYSHTSFHHIEGHSLLYAPGIVFLQDSL